MSPTPRRKFQSLSAEEKERIRGNIRRLEEAQVGEAEVERYLRERENLERPGDKPSPSERLAEMKATHKAGKERDAKEQADAKERKNLDRIKAKAPSIPAVAKTEEGAHVLPRMTITAPTSPKAANKAHRPSMQGVEQALPAAGKAAKAALREALPDQLALGMARGAIRTPTDLVAGAAALLGKKDLKAKSLAVSEKLSGLFGDAQTPVGEVAEYLPLEAAGLAAGMRIVPTSPRISAPNRGAFGALAKNRADKLASRALPPAPERKLLKAPDPEDLLAGVDAIPEIAQLVRGMQLGDGALASGAVRRKVKDIPREAGERFARVYEGLPENDPAAKGAYDALNAEVSQQMAAIKKAGYTIEFVDTDPYKSSADLFKDLRDNKRLRVFKTGDDAVHPYMTKEQNDAFRAVHDFVAHGGGGNQFGKIGEENAYRIHASTLSPQARRALATETRGQNSWVNFGPHADLPPAKRPFAKQKAALWPEEMLGDYDTLPPEILSGPAIPIPAKVKPTSSTPLGEVVRLAENARRDERSTRLFGSPSPAPLSPEEIIGVEGMRPRSVADAAGEMRKAGIPKHRRFTGQFLKGEAEKLQGPGRGRRGAVDPALVGVMGGATIGALTGAAVNDDPVEGALLGLGMGSFAGGALGRLGGKGVRLARTPALGKVAEGIEFGMARPPVTGMQLKAKVMHALDRWSPFEALGEKLDKIGVRPSNNPMHVKSLMLSSATRTHQALRGEGLIDPHTMERLGPSLEQVFEPIGDGWFDVQTAQAYLKAKRDVGRVERMGLDAVGGDAALHQAALDAIANESPALAEFGKRWGEYTNALGEYAVRSGLWTPEQWDKILDSDALYVPFHRIRDGIKHPSATSATGAPRSGLNIGSGVRAFSGSNRSVTDLVDAMATHTDAIIKRADRYALSQSLRDGVVEAVQQGHTEMFEVLSPAAKSPYAEMERKVMDALEREGIEPGVAEAMSDLYLPGLSKDNPILTLNKPGGGKEYWRVNSPELVETLAHLTPDRDGVKMLVLWPLMVAKRITTAAKTGLNPGFGFGTNPLRDTVDAWGKSRDALTFREMAKGWYDTILGSGAIAPVAGATAGGAIGAEAENASGATVGAVVGGALGLKLRARLQPKVAKDLLREIETMGGVGSTSIVAREVAPGVSVARFAPSTRTRRFRAVVSEIVQKPIEALETVASVSDAGTRVAAWKAAVRAKQHLVKSGKWTPKDLRMYAASQARGATVDFGRKPGNEILSTATEIVPFLNAAIQGGVRYGRAWKHSPQRMAMMSSGVAAAVGISWALNERSENPVLLNDRTSTERAAYLHFPIPDVDTVLRVPLGQENGVIAAAVGYALSHLTENDPAAAQRLKEAFWRLVPDAYLPVVSELREIDKNRANYGNRPIETEKMEGLLPEERKLPTTRPTYAGLARVARKVGFQDTSPQQAEHMVRGVLGPFADIAADALGDEIAIAAGEDPATESRAPRSALQHPLNPLRAVLSPSVPTRTQGEDTFYRTLEGMDQAGRSLRELDRGLEGRPERNQRIQEFLNDPERGGRLARSEGGDIDLGYSRRIRAEVNAARLQEKELLAMWQRGEMDEMTYRAETARYRAARQAGYRNALRQLHDAGVFLDGPGRYPRP